MRSWRKRCCHWAVVSTPGELPLEVDVSMSASSCSCVLSSALPSSTPAAALGVSGNAWH